VSGILAPDFWIYVGVIAGIYTIFALGLQVQYGVAGLVNLGQVAFMAIGAYTMAILVVKLGWSMLPASAAAIGAAMLFALVLGLPTLRLRADYLAMVTIAAGEIVRYLALNLQDITGGPIGTTALLGAAKLAAYNGEWQRFQKGVQSTLGGVTGGGVSPDSAMLVVVWAVAFVLLTCVWLMVRSPWGRVLRAIREDEDAAEALGKDTFRYKMQALVLGAALGALAGLFIAWQVSVFTPNDFRPTFTFYAYIIIILGGPTRVWAVPVGAILFGILFAGTRFLDFWPLNELDSGDRAYLRLLLVGLLLMVLMALRPQGLFGKRQELLLEQ
jgi:ABC-type branched-subunit amino acid transport system permease subunit